MFQNQSIPLLLNDFISLFYPNNCYSCNSTLSPSENTICLHCKSAIQEAQLIDLQPNSLHSRFYEIPNLRYAFAFAWFHKKGIVQKLIHQLKYKGEKSVGIYLGELYGRELKRKNYNKTIDMVTCVPLHYLKYRKRGYNQSEVIAKALADSAGIPFKRLIKKKYHRDSQTKKQRIDRFANTDHSFGLLTDRNLSGKHVLIVDDVLTTGATMQAACQPLIKKAATVSIFTVAAVK